MAETGHDHEKPMTPDWAEALQSASFAEYLRGCRWFGGKAQTMRGVQVLEALPVGDAGNLVLLRVDYLEAPAETYLVPMRLASADGTDVWRDALEDEKFRAALLEVILEERRLCCATGELAGICGAAFKTQARVMVEQRHSHVLTVEQSNSSVLYDDRWFLKLYRRPETGGNPDVEMLRYLSEKQKFANVPGYCGGIEYRCPGAEPRVLALLVTNVPNAGTAWTSTLRGLMQRSSADPIAGSEDLGRARLLGERTAQMHLALEAERKNPDFVPEAFDESYCAMLRRSMAETTRRMIQLLEQKLEALPLLIQPEAAELIRREDEIRQRHARLLESDIPASRIRIHGDYHLGQVLDTEGDFVIIDFEGEPARSLNERCMKHSPLRDVAGMLRSFDYAAHTVMGQQGSDGVDLKEWTERVGEEFLNAYLSTAQGASFLPEDEKLLHELLDASLLEKAVYEVCYELNNRPDWAVIPLRGVLRILDRSV